MMMHALTWSMHSIMRIAAVRYLRLDRTILEGFRLPSCGKGGWKGERVDRIYCKSSCG